MEKEWKFDGLESLGRFVLWDLAGQSQFKKVRQSYLSNAEAGILAFDVTNPSSFQRIENWHKEILSASPNISLILVGNKIDLVDNRVVSMEDGEKTAEKLVDNIDELKIRLSKNKIFEESFKRNTKLIDFKYIPKEIKEKILKKAKEVGIEDCKQKDKKNAR